VVFSEQLPSVLTACTGRVELGAVLVVLVELGTVTLELGRAPDPARYQFCFGSFKHSPTVTDLKPLLYMDARI
jgi:hypothetical protein